MLARALFCVIAFPSIAVAQQDCNPADIKDVKFSYQDVWTELNYVHDKTTKQTDNSASEGALSVFNVASLSGSAKNSYMYELNDLVKYNFQGSEKTYLYLSAFSDASLKAYEDCLANSYRNIYIIPSTNSPDAAEFTVKVRLRKYPGDFNLHTIASITGGKIRSAPDQSTLNSDCTSTSGDRRQTRRFHRKRDPSTSFEMKVEVGNGAHRDDAVMRLPPRVEKRWVVEKRYGEIYHSACKGCFNPANQSGSIVLNVGNDEVIVPRTEYLFDGSDGSSPGSNPSGSGLIYRNIIDIDAYSKEYRAHSVSIPICINSTRGTDWCGSWMISADVVLAIPIDQEHSSKYVARTPRMTRDALAITFTLNRSLSSRTT